MVDREFESMSIADLLERLERNIRYGCHSTCAEAGRSFAGQELRRRGRDAGFAIIRRLLEMNQQPLNAVELRVSEGLVMVLCWMIPNNHLGQIGLPAMEATEKLELGV